MKDDERKQRTTARPDPGPARLYALLAGALLAMLGVLGFFYDASFGTGTDLASDDLAGLLNVNGWRNVVYLASGILALALASGRPRATAAGIGFLYLVLAIWGFDVTERGIGSILDWLPLGDNDNALHLALGILGLGAALIDGPLPAVPQRLRPKRRKPRTKRRRVGKATIETEKPSGEEKRQLPRPRFGSGKGRSKPKEKRSPARDEPSTRRRFRAGPRPDDAV